MTEWFDDLSRVLATPMPRRRAIRLAASALAGSFLPFALIHPARADTAGMLACLNAYCPPGQYCDPTTVTCKPGPCGSTTCMGDDFCCNSDTSMCCPWNLVCCLDGCSMIGCDENGMAVTF